MTPDQTIRNLYALSARLCLAAKDLAATPQTEAKLANTLETVRTMRLQAKTIFHAANAAETVLQDALHDYREKLDAQAAQREPKEPTPGRKRVDDLLAKHGLAIA